jgi:ribosomal protein S18 acetylase RimI-like enzyme
MTPDAPNRPPQEFPAPAFREATREDLPCMIQLLAGDPLGALREAAGDGVSPAYEAAFQAIAADPNHQLLVVEVEGTMAGFLQLSFLPHLTYEGGTRAQIEGVRVDEAFRSRGLGEALFGEAVRRARERGCHMVQLTTDLRRPDALRFYERLGFQATHHGMKLHLPREEDSDGGG